MFTESNTKHCASNVSPQPLNLLRSFCSSFPLPTRRGVRGVRGSAITMTTIQSQPSISESSLLPSSSLFTELRREVHPSLSLAVRWIIGEPRWRTAVRGERPLLACAQCDSVQMSLSFSLCLKSAGCPCASGH